MIVMMDFHLFDALVNCTNFTTFSQLISSFVLRSLTLMLIKLSHANKSSQEGNHLCSSLRLGSVNGLYKKAWYYCQTKARK